ncbi:MAG: DUF4430 domain-containing protein [Patescibacteria group bacterium]|nr:DUF4430 domain-containing protein [Patescibacteria group bacterium]
MQNFISKFKIVLLALALSFLAVACNSKPAVIPDATANQQVSTVKVTEVVEGSDLAEQPYDLPVGQSALELLKSNHQVSTKTFAGVGEFVEVIDGIKPDNQHYWAFYINGKSSNVGAGSYELKNGDKIEWKLETINSYGQ